MEKTVIKKMMLSAALVFAATTFANAQSLPNYGANAPANVDSYGKPYSGAKPLPQRRGYRAYGYVRGHHYDRGHRRHHRSYRYYR